MGRAEEQEVLARSSFTIRGGFTIKALQRKGDVVDEMVAGDR